MSVSGIADAVFSYIFIMRMRLGVVGSVYSTVVGAVLMLALTGSHILRRKGALRFTRAAFERTAVLLSARTGFATSLQYLFQFITMIAVNRILMRLAGSAAVAAFDVVYNISLLCASIADGTSVAIEPMCSTYRSERNLGNIRMTLFLAFIWAGVISAVFSAVLLVFSRQFSFLFGMRSGVELHYTSVGIRIYALSILPAMANILFSGYYSSILREGFAYLITFLRSFLFYLVALYLCSLAGMKTFWYVFLVAETLALVTWMITACLKGGLLQLQGIDTSRTRTAVITSSGEDIAGMVEQMQDYCSENGADPRQVMYVGLVMEEICCAIVDRFRDRMGNIYIQITVVMEDDGTTLFLRDNAYEFNPLGEDTDQIDLNEGRQVNLVGLKIVQKKAKEFYYRRYSGFNTLVVRL